MNILTLWLLISVGSSYHGASASPSNVVERFPTAESCQQVAKAMIAAANNRPPDLICVHATVVKP